MSKTSVQITFSADPNKYGNNSDAGENIQIKRLYPSLVYSSPELIPGYEWREVIT